jgi:hypothetical protein
LRLLLDYPSFRTIRSEAQQAGFNYLVDYIIFDTGIAKVELREVDFWINATYIIYTAGRTRNTVTMLRRKIDYEIVYSSSWQGTYIDFQDRLKLSEKYKLDLLTNWLKRIKEDSWQDWLGLPTEDSPDYTYSQYLNKEEPVAQQKRRRIG